MTFRGRFQRSLPAAAFMGSQLLVQGLSLGCNVLALGLLPLREVGLLSVQTALVAWLYFTHAGSLNHLYNVLPGLNGPDNEPHRRDILRSGVGAVLAIAFPATAILGILLALQFRREIGSASDFINFVVGTLLTVLGQQWIQVKECDIKSRGDRQALASWNLVVAVGGLVPLLLLAVLPTYIVFLYRAAVGSFGVLAWVLSREGLLLVRPRFTGIVGLVTGGAGVMLSQILSVLLLQGERLLMARRFNVETVGAMQLYFILQTGAQLVPAMAMNLWYPGARRDPATLGVATQKAVRFSFAALGGLALCGCALGVVLEAGLAGAKYQHAASGLVAGGLLVPAFTMTSLLFTFMVLDELAIFVCIQFALLIVQVALYWCAPAGLPFYWLIAMRGLLLYGGLCVAFLLAAFKLGWRKNFARA